MKKTFFSVIASLTLLATSCKKDAPVSPTDLSGTTWTGTVNVPGFSYVDLPFVLNFYENGIMTGSLNNAGAENAIGGTWEIIPNSTTVKLFFGLQTIPGTYTGRATLTSNNTKMESGIAVNTTTPLANLNFKITKF